MKGAKNLLCNVCGGFYSHFHKQDHLGRVTIRKSCDCGAGEMTIRDGLTIKRFVYDKAGNTIHKEIYDKNTAKS